MNSQMPIEFTIAPRARAAIKGQWATALPMGFLTGILYTALSVVMNLMLNPAMEQVVVLMEQGYPPEYVLQWMTEHMAQAMVPVGLLSILSALVTPALSMGMHHYALKLLRGQEGRLGDILSRMGIFLKSLGLSLMVGVRTFLWMLLGIAAYGLIVFAATFVGDGEMILGIVPMLAALAVLPGIIAMFRYMMAEFAMADVPSRGINESIRLSKRLTHKRKMRLMSLLVGWALLSNLGGSLLQAFLGPILGMTFGMLVSLACSVYMEMLKASYYLTYTEWEARPVQEDSPELT